MAMNADDIKVLIEQNIPCAHADVTDLAGDGEHYAVTVTSTTFKDKSRVDQHKLVYQALGGRMGDILHALSVTTKIV